MRDTESKGGEAGEAEAGPQEVQVEVESAGARALGFEGPAMVRGAAKPNCTTLP